MIGAVIANSAVGSPHPKDPNLRIQHVMLVDQNGDPISISGGTGGSPAFWSTSAPLVDSTPIVVELGGVATSVYRIAVNPVAGDSILVETGTSSSGPWTPWPRGAASTADDATWYPGIPAVTHMRFTRTAGSGTTSHFYVDEISN